MNRKSYFLMIGLVGLALLATSCRRLPYAGPAVEPSVTPTPRSTALPPVPTSIPLGTDKNPLHMKVVKPTSGQEQAPSTLTDLQKALLDQSKLTVDVELADSDAEALAALCNSPSGTVTIAWLSGIAYAAAYAQNCGTAALQVQRGSGSSASTGDQSRILVKANSDASAASDLSGKTFCRLGYTDLYSWLIPSLLLKAGGVATGDLKSITDYDDPSKMIADVASGKCDAAGISGSQFSQVASATQRQAVRTLQQSVNVPYAVLVIPSMLLVGQQQEISDALVALGNGTHSDELKPLLNQDQIVPVSDDDLASLRNFIRSAELDLAQAGT